MLSRVAERLYWTGRLIERAENTARLISVYANLLLDLPRPVRLGWDALLNITGSEELFSSRYQNADERNVVKFLLTDRFNPGSILCSLAQARENTRTTREVVPSEGLEQINDLYWFAKEHTDKGVTRRNRFKLLEAIILHCQQINGLLAGTMSHDSGYRVTRLGRSLERADMTTRILDVGAVNLLERDGEEPGPHQSILWMSVLNSLSAYQSYRQHVRTRVQGEDVLAYLLHDLKFPRSVGHCLHEAEFCLLELPRNEAPLRSIVRLRRRVAECEVSTLVTLGLHDFIDELQFELGTAHESITATYFALESEEKVSEDTARFGPTQATAA